MRERQLRKCEVTQRQGNAMPGRSALGSGREIKPPDRGNFRDPIKFY